MNQWGTYVFISLTMHSSSIDYHLYGCCKHEDSEKLRSDILAATHPSSDTIDNWYTQASKNGWLPNIKLLIQTHPNFRIKLKYQCAIALKYGNIEVMRFWYNRILQVQGLTSKVMLELYSKIGRVLNDSKCLSIEALCVFLDFGKAYHSQLLQKLIEISIELQRDDVTKVLTKKSHLSEKERFKFVQKAFEAHSHKCVVSLCQEANVPAAHEIAESLLYNNLQYETASLKSKYFSRMAQYNLQAQRYPHV